MSEKKKTISEQADQIRQELDDLIGDGVMDVESDPKDLPIQSKPTDLAPIVNYGLGTATLTTEIRGQRQKIAQRAKRDPFGF